MNALTVQKQNLCHKMKETGITITDKKIIADNTDLTIKIIIVPKSYHICACMYVCVMTGRARK